MFAAILATLFMLPAVLSTRKELQFDMDFVKSPNFVDKSDLIESFFNERSGHYNFISCPRSFGKTLNIQMLKTFFNFEVDSLGNIIDPIASSSYPIIQQLKIYNNRPVMRQHFGRHPVFLLDLKYTIKETPTVDSIEPWLISRIQESYMEYHWLLDKIKENYAAWRPSICEYELQYFEQALHADLNSTQILEALMVLPKILYRFFKHSKAVILIDHYDHFQLNVDHVSQSVVDHAYDLINKILMHPFNQTYHYFWYGFGALTSSQKLPTGVSWDGRLRNYVFLDEHIFSDHFGFTADEMDGLYLRYNCSLEEKLLIKKWYNGYSAWVKRKAMFQPYSVSQYFANRGSPNALRCYWPKIIPSHNLLPMLKVPEFREKIIQLITFRKATMFVRKSRFNYQRLPRFSSLSLKFDELVETSELHEMYSFFFENGYLGHTAAQTEFKIPNMEVRQYFGKVLAHLYKIKEIPINAIRDLFIRTLQSTDHDPGVIEEEIRVQFGAVFSLICMPKFRTTIKFEYYSILHISALEIRSILPEISVNFKATVAHRGDVLIIDKCKVLIVSLHQVRRIEEAKELPATLNYSLPVKGITRVIFVHIVVGEYGEVKTSLRDYGSDTTDEEQKEVYRNQWQSNTDHEHEQRYQQDQIRLSEDSESRQNVPKDSLYSLPEVE